MAMTKAKAPDAAPKAAVFRPAVRAGVGALIGIAGETGSGKTLSALRTARGLAALPGEDLNDPATLAIIDARIAFIDTEAGRALHYAVAAGELPQPFPAATFGFCHADMHAPFSPAAYRAMIEAADEAHFAVIVIDSFTHEWDGEDGCIEMHDDDLDAMVERSRKRDGDKSWWNEDTQREKLSITAWKRPKMEHKRMVSRMLQTRAHLIVCMRAEDKLRIESKKEEGQRFAKTVIINAADLPPAKRWQPICEKRFPYQMITSFVLTPDAPGVAIPLKLQEQHRSFLREGQPLDETFGFKLASWARGAEPAKKRTAAASSSFAAADREGGATKAKAKVAPLAASDDEFPGDRRAPSPSVVIQYNGRKFDVSNPCALIEDDEAADKLSAKDLQALGAALRKILQACSSHQRDAWIGANWSDLNVIKSKSIKLYDWLLEFPELI